MLFSLLLYVFEIFQDKKFLSLDNVDPVPSEFPIGDHKRHFKLGHVNLLSHFKTEVWPNSVLPKAGKKQGFDFAWKNKTGRYT